MTPLFSLNVPGGVSVRGRSPGDHTGLVSGVWLVLTEEASTTESQTRAQSSDGARPTQPTHGHLSVTIWGELDHVNRPWQLSYTQRYLDDDDDDVDIAELIKPRRKSTADATARIKRWVFNKIKIFRCLLKVFFGFLSISVNCQFSFSFIWCKSWRGYFGKSCFGISLI